MEQVYDLFPILKDKRKSGRGRAFGRPAPASRRRPRADDPADSVLMLDEPTAGVSPIVMDELFDRIIEVARTGISILMVEQNARQALEIADTGYVLVQGRNAHTGTGKALLEDPEVRRTFLGGDVMAIHGGTRPTLGGRTQHLSNANRRRSATRGFGAGRQRCALPGGGSGAARPATGLRGANGEQVSKAPGPDELLCKLRAFAAFSMVCERLRDCRNCSL